MCITIFILYLLIFFQFIVITDTFILSKTKSIVHYNKFNDKNLHVLNAKKKKKRKPIPLVPEFSRVLNTGQIPRDRPVMCRLLARDKEREGLAERFDMPEITYFSANVTAKRADRTSILVQGNLEAHIKAGKLLRTDSIVTTFETMLLDNTGVGIALSLEDATEYDDQVDENGDIDIGEIASQYLSLELF